MRFLITFSCILLLAFLPYSSPAQHLELGITSEVTLDPLLVETSGIIYTQGKLWTHNDSGGEPEIYAINPVDGSILQTVRLEGLVNHDWENIAADDSFLYIADTGNNWNGSRSDLAIYKIKLEDLPHSGDTILPFHKIEIIDFYYPEQGINPMPVKPNSTPFDCEAIYVNNDTIHLFTKDWTSVDSGYGSSEYILPNFLHPEGEKHAAKFIARYDEIGFLVTGADNWNSEYVVLIGYQIQSVGAHFIRLYSDIRHGDLLSGKEQLLLIGSALTYGQTEAICFGEEPTKGYITNETFHFGVFTYPASLKQFELYPASSEDFY